MQLMKVVVSNIFRLSMLKEEESEVRLLKSITEGDSSGKTPDVAKLFLYHQLVSNCGSSVYMTNPKVLCSKSYSSNFFRR